MEAELGEKEQIIASKISSELVKHIGYIGYNVFGEWRAKYAPTIKVQAPNFYTLRIDTTLSTEE